MQRAQHRFFFCKQRTAKRDGRVFCRKGRIPTGGRRVERGVDGLERRCVLGGRRAGRRPHAREHEKKRRDDDGPGHALRKHIGRFSPQRGAGAMGGERGRAGVRWG